MGRIRDGNKKPDQVKIKILVLPRMASVAAKIARVRRKECFLVRKAAEMTIAVVTNSKLGRIRERRRRNATRKSATVNMFERVKLCKYFELKLRCDIFPVDNVAGLNLITVSANAGRFAVDKINPSLGGSIFEAVY